MTDHELRALVRDAVGRHLGGGSSGQPALVHSQPPSTTARAHPSHAQYLTLVNVGDACLIEPSVGCNHCGYCKSHGH